MRKKLGVNIDHVATLREARKAQYPDPVEAAVIAELAGADGITIHLREDRRHIQDRDVYVLRSTVKSSLNLEMALNPDVLEIALKVMPDDVCIVPENREEVTTEGGLDAAANMDKLREFIPALRDKRIAVSLFIDPDPRQVEASKAAGADYIEIHTGRYADAKSESERLAELEKIRNAAGFAQSLGLRVNAGHGLHYLNTAAVCAIPQIETLNIGHSIISRAVYVGLDRAIRDMLGVMCTK
ncbi:MAG: pyridoxine 5'-phosphate synthase [Spirochaetes bacterium GWF1_51_8]|nr:MAG: pyridoxine 5'-phosphate synthase [Spirochaetes bacterium GWF1_51_8]